MKYQYDDGGRAAAGFKGICGDCGTGVAAIALGLPYREVYDELNLIRKEMLAKARSSRTKKRLSNSVRNGTSTDVMDEFMKRHGWEWVAKMRIGSGCTMHVCDMPMGRFVCVLAKHYCAVIDGTIHDIFEVDSNRCVYAYWRKR